jgi:hypothetical protein
MVPMNTQNKNNLMTIVEKLHETISSVLIIHPVQKNKTDIYAAEKCSKIVEDISVKFLIFAKDYPDTKSEELFKLFKTTKNL